MRSDFSKKTIKINRHSPSGQSRVYRVAQLRTDGVHCQKSTATVPVVLKVVPVTGAAFFRFHHGPINVRLSFPTPFIGMYGHTYRDQPGKVANPARGQLNRQNEYSPVPVRA